MKDKPEITERAQHLLKVLVQRYIRDGQPVGSKTLAEDTCLQLSSATIRHVMADLEHCGYLTSPHTSAGRIPTAQGYRLFVDSLLTVKEIDDLNVQQWQAQLPSSEDASTHQLMQSVSTLLSGMTKLAGLVTIPRQEHMTLRHVEFLPLSANRVLVILVLNEKEVQNRIIYTDRVYNSSELQAAANYINDQYAGCEMSDLHKLMVNAMQSDRQSLEQLLQTIVDVADKAFEEDGKADDDYVVSGQDNLLNYAPDNDMEQIRGLFEAMSHKRDILHLLDKCTRADGLQIYIGEESGYHLLDGSSVVAAPYQVDGEVAGVLGVIGPTRMSYERVIPVVDVTAKLLSAALNKSD